MKTSELIAKLQASLMSNGDLEVGSFDQVDSTIFVPFDTVEKATFDGQYEFDYVLEIK